MWLELARARALREAPVGKRRRRVMKRELWRCVEADRRAAFERGRCVKRHAYLWTVGPELDLALRDVGVVPLAGSGLKTSSFIGFTVLALRDMKEPATLPHARYYLCSIE